MLRHFCSMLILAGLVVACLAADLAAQQVTISVPQQNISTGYYEFIGGRWVYFGPGFGFSVGGPFAPQFGGFNPNGGLSGGFGYGGSGTWGMFNFNAVQGGSTSYTSTTPMLTVTNGIPGSITFGEFRPFVTGVVPTLGGGLASNPAFANLGASNSLNGRLSRGEFHIRNGRVIAGPDPLLQLPAELSAPPNLFAPQPAADGVAREAPEDWRQIARRAEAETADALEESSNLDEANAKAADLWNKGRQLEAAGKVGAARLLYQTAARQATGDLHDQILSRLRMLD